ncbi:EF-hand domain-containing protein [Novosphingobium album (ex Liu et al. 2023)]|nr:hypothetical protein [Novosphingobium album (ex Liu et al. 2023)]
MIGLPIAALAMAGGAYAQQSTRPDADGNGTLTRAEMQTHAAAMFTRMDANKDGKLDKADRTARMEEMRAKRFAALDANSDGQISRAEFMVQKPMGDGPMANRGDKGQDGKDRGHRGWGKRGGHGGMMMMGRMADADKDGAITQAEFTAAAAKHFDMLDANKDGQVTKEERQAARAQMKAKWQEMRASKAAN